MWENLIYLLISLSCVGQSFSQCMGGTLLRAGGLTCDDKKIIISKHNTLRQRVAEGSEPNQPSAKNMLETVWDDELAQKAQTHADKCINEHDTYDDRRVSRFEVGQNLRATSNSPKPDSLKDKPDFPRAIQKWYDEVLNYNYTTNSSPNGKVIGHYTQVAWAKTYAIGCGYVYYQDGNNYRKLYVCDYGPAGNFNGEKPYESGSGCTNAGTSTSPQYSALCRMSGTHYGGC